MTRPTEHDKTPEGTPTTSFDFTITAEDAGVRLDKWLSDTLEEFTRTRLKALIDGGAVTRNGEVFADPSYRIREGENYSLTPPPVESPTPQPQAIPLEIAYEDEDLIVINKRAGMVVHPAAGNWDGTLVNALIAHCGDTLSGIGGEARPGIVHRLDKDTSGLLVVAKHDRAHVELSKAFSVHDIERVYEAVVTGAPRPGVGTVHTRIARASTGDRKKMVVISQTATRTDAKQAITHYRICETYGRGRAKLAGDAVASLVECQLETGRTHQIRVHMTHIGHPLVGDPVYGRGPGLAGLKPGDEAANRAIATVGGFRRQALHARILGFSHPITGETLRFEAAAPADFQKLVAALKAL